MKVFSEFSLYVLFQRQEMNVKEPSGARTSPRSHKSKYIYNQDNSNNILEIINNIIDGLPIEKIHPSIYPQLYAQLQKKYRELLQIHNIKQCSSIQTAINYIETSFPQALTNFDDTDEFPISIKLDDDLPGSAEEDLTEAEKEKLKELRKYQLYLADQEEKRKEQLNFTEEEIHLGIQLALDGDFESLDHRLVKKLIPELRRLQQEALANSQYIEAGQYFETARKLNILTTNLSYGRITSERADELESKVFNMSFDLARLKQQWNQKIEDVQIQLDNDINYIIQEQNRRLQEFDAQFEEEEIPTTYCKYSNQISELKKKKEYLLCAKRYEEAAEVHDQMVTQMKSEEKQFRVKYIQDLVVKREAFVKQIEKKIAAKQEAAKMAIDRLYKKRNREIEQAKKTLKRFELKSQQADDLASSAMFTLTNTKSSANPQSNYNLSTSGRSNNFSISSRNNRADDASSARWSSSHRSRSERSNMRARSYRSVRTSFPTSQERSSQEIFRQRRAINSIIYTRTQYQLPKIKGK